MRRGLQAGLLGFEGLDLLGLGVGRENGDLLLKLLRLGLQRFLLAGDVSFGLVAIPFDLVGDILADLGEAQDGLAVDQEDPLRHGRRCRRRIGGQRGRGCGNHEGDREKRLFHRLRILFQQRSEESAAGRSWS